MKRVMGHNVVGPQQAGTELHTLVLKFVTLGMYPTSQNMQRSYVVSLQCLGPLTIDSVEDERYYVFINLIYYVQTTIEGHY